MYVHGSERQKRKEGKKESRLELAYTYPSNEFYNRISVASPVGNHFSRVSQHLGQCGVRYVMPPRVHLKRVHNSLLS
jgi:hypothetical protein